MAKHYRRPIYRSDRERELSRVAERLGGNGIDNQLAAKCGYYPLFTFRKWIDHETGEVRCGQVLVCKECTLSDPNPKCKHSHILDI